MTDLTTAARNSRGDAEGWDRKKTEGFYKELIALRFGDGSKLRLTVEVEASARAYASAAGEFLERLRRAIEETG